MRFHPRQFSLAEILFAILTTLAPGQPSPGTAFTYQGQLKRNGSPVNATVAMSFKLWDTSTGGTQQGSTLTFDGASGHPAVIDRVVSIAAATDVLGDDRRDLLRDEADLAVLAEMVVGTRASTQSASSMDNG